MNTTTTAKQVAWHQSPATEVARLLEVDLPRGLATADVHRRREKYGPNRLTARRGKSELLRFLLQFHQPLIYILLAATAITAVLGEWVDASVIFGVVLVNAIVGYLQEAKAEKAIEALAEMVVTEATVRRDGASGASPPKNSCPATWCCCNPATACRRTCACSACAICRSTNPR